MAQTNSRPEAVAHQIKRRWQDEGLTQRDLGEVLGLDAEVAGRRLRGLTLFKIEEIGLIADRLQSDVTIVIGDEVTVTFTERQS